MEMPKIEVYAQFYGRINRRTASGQRVTTLRCEDLTTGFLPDCENPNGRNRRKALQEPELAEPMYDPETGEAATFTMEEVLILAGSPWYVPEKLPYPKGGYRAENHSLNDGLRDTRWRRADRAVNRWIGSLKAWMRAAPKTAIDEVPLFMAKVLGAGLVVYAVCVAAVQYYG